MTMRNLPELINEFIAHCRFEKQLSEKTIKAYSIDLKQFNDFCKSKCFDLCLINFDKTIISQYLQHLNGLYKVKSIKRKIACLKTAFKYYEFERDDFSNPFNKIRISLKIPFKVPTVMNLGEVTSVFQYMYAMKDQQTSHQSEIILTRDIALLELLFATGLRVSELSHLRHQNIDLEEGTLTVHGKGSKDRVIQICNHGVLRALREYEIYHKDKMVHCEYFFINRLHTRLSEQSIRNVVKKYASAVQSKKTVTPHTYRHTFATMLLEEGVDIKYIQRILGHSSILTTQIYTHVSNVKQREILSLQHPRNRIITEPVQ